MTNLLALKIGLQVRRLRKRNAISQSALGNMLVPAITHTGVSEIERGLRSATVVELIQLADIFKVPISYFFDGIALTSNDRHDLVAEPLSDQPHALSIPRGHWKDNGSGTLHFEILDKEHPQYDAAEDAYILGVNWTGFGI